jgi:hypothetical protein
MNATVASADHDHAPSLALTMALAAAAGGLGWGIRGQFGHETGAMIAGLLVCTTLVLLLCPHGISLALARAVAWGTVGIGFGGSETYGQTVGLTHEADLVGNWEALRWGMLGLSVKGAVWIGFCGLLFGMGLGGKRYRVLELAALLAAMIALLFVGRWLFNTPFEPSEQLLPRWYFSFDWHFLPRPDLKPRPEFWGGLLCALLAGVVFVGIRRDSLALRLALWAMLGGAIGFPLGQCIQAFHAWNPQLFADGFGQSIDGVNWWNCMETTFGATWGATLALGLWLNRHRIATDPAPLGRTMPLALEFTLIAVHVASLLADEFIDVRWFAPIGDIALPLGVIPILAVAAGRVWPYFMVLPLTALPICGKMVRRFVYENEQISLVWGWIVYAIVPLACATFLAAWLSMPSRAAQSGRAFPRATLLFAVWLYYGLNHAFFQFSLVWPTIQRTPNDLVFLGCALGLTWAVWRFREESPTAVQAT